MKKILKSSFIMFMAVATSLVMKPNLANASNEYMIV